MLYPTTIVNSSVNITVQINNFSLFGSGQTSHRRLLSRLPGSIALPETLTGSSIQEYGDRPLSQILTSTITPEVERCRVVLRELFDIAKSTWDGLNHTNISNLWRQVWWSRWDADELATLRIKLSQTRKSLYGFLKALHSVAWVELGNKLHGDQVSIRRFHDLLSQRLPFLCHIKINTVQVVNHSGEVIPVPIMFCSTWKDFHYIINGYCRNSLGNHFIRQGDYNVMRAEDKRVIGRSELASRIESGMILEMSVILLQTVKGKCPRCYHINVISGNSTWINCSKCPAQFQATEAGDSGETNDEKVNGERGEVDETNDRDNEPMTVSPHLTRSGATHYEDPELENDDGALCYRRFHIIYKSPLLSGGIHIHPILGFNSRAPPLLFDLSLTWRDARTNTSSLSHLSDRTFLEPAIYPPMDRLSLINIPWTLTILPSSQPFVAIIDVLKQLFHWLQRKVSRMEWELEPRDSQLGITYAFYQRITRDLQTAAVEKRKGLKRVDFLEGHNQFLGLSSTRQGPAVWALHVR